MSYFIAAFIFAFALIATQQGRIPVENPDRNPPRELTPVAR